MNPLRVYVCDDEPLAVTRLLALLSRLPEVEVVGSAHDGDGALRELRTVQPDLVLLDIEMPGLDGFDVVEQLQSPERIDGSVPIVAFVTAFRHFAPEAFDCGAIDFLSKPVRFGRLVQTIQRTRAAVEGREASNRLVDLQGALERLRADSAPKGDPHVWISRRKELLRVDLNSVNWVAAEGAYVRLHVDANSYLHREAMGCIAQRLNPSHFVRVHRSHLVRVAHVASVCRTPHGGIELVLRSGDRVPVGRRYAKETRRLLYQRDFVG